MFLIQKNPERKKLHSLQLESCEIKDDNAKNEKSEDINLDNMDPDDLLDPFNKRKFPPIKIEKIANTLVGMKTYERTINDEKMVDYVMFS